jgi:hypothetical protein
VKIYLTQGFDGIGEHDTESVACSFDDKKVDFQVMSWATRKGNVNFRLRLDPLGGAILPDECKINVKANSVSITLKKAEAGKEWTDILDKPAEEEGEERKDANGDFMGKLTQAYDQGDDEMKEKIMDNLTRAQ